MLPFSLLALMLSVTTHGPTTGLSLPTADSVASDSLYRSARAALSRGAWQSAARLFAQVIDERRGPDVANAHYWQAFALYRLGGTSNLRRASSLLDVLQSRYPNATTSRDGAALAARIRGSLARGGDADAAEAVAIAAADAAMPMEVPEPPMAPMAPIASMAAGASSARALAELDRSRARLSAARARLGAASRSRREDRCSNAEDDDVKMAALNGLLQMDEERAMPILQKVLARRDSASLCLRRKAVFLVAQQRTAETENILLASLRGDPDAEVRSQSVFWLSQVGTARAVGALDSILQKSSDEDLRGRALFALSQQDGAVGTDALRRFARQPGVPAELRKQAIFWLGRRGDLELPFLREMYAKSSDADERQHLLFSASQTGDAATPFLLEVARDGRGDLESRKQAIFLLSQSKGGDVGTLSSIYQSADQRELKDQVIFALSQRREPAALDKLIEISKKDADRELRKKALFWVGQSRDPRAVKALQEILDQ